MSQAAVEAATAAVQALVPSINKAYQDAHKKNREINIIPFKNVSSNSMENALAFAKHLDTVHLLFQQNNIEDPEEKLIIYKNQCGEHLLNILDLVPDPAGTDDVWKKATTKLKKRFLVEKLRGYCAVQLMKATQKPNQSFFEYETQLRNFAKYAGYDDKSDQLIMDRIFAGTTERKIAERATKENQTLAELINFASDVLSARSQVQAVQDKPSINFVTKVDSVCKACTYQHPKGSCPAYGKTCHVCNMKNHFRSSVFCKKKQNSGFARNKPSFGQKGSPKNFKNSKYKQVNTVEVEKNEEEEVLELVNSFAAEGISF